MTRMRASYVCEEACATYAKEIGLDVDIRVGSGETLNQTITADVFEAFVAEAIIQNLMAGMYVEITDVRRNFKHEHFANVVCEYARKYNIV